MSNPFPTLNLPRSNMTKTAVGMKGEWEVAHRHPSKRSPLHSHHVAPFDTAEEAMAYVAHSIAARNVADLPLNLYGEPTAAEVRKWSRERPSRTSAPASPSGPTGGSK